MTQPTTITIDDVEYVRKDSAQKLAPTVDGLQHVLIRTYSAGVHVGYLKSRDGREVELVNARRVWYWDGAASLSQLATDGTSKPKSCKISVEVPSIILTEAIEVIATTEKAQKSIAGVSPWVA